ncbi:MAG: serine/threonine protein kinase, partial [Terriglobales bacterium]
VMDHINGISLSELIKKEGALSLEDALAIVAQICDGVAHAHEMSVLHRDLKPSNIMVSRSESGEPLVNIVDFGIAKLMDAIDPQNNLTQTGQMFGSPAYMSPEQSLGRAVDERSDVYAIGCILYEMLTGGPPLEDESYMGTLLKQINEKPLSLREASLGRHFPWQLEAITARCLAKDSAMRFQSASTLRDALLDYEKYGKSDEAVKALVSTRQYHMGNMLLSAIIACVLLLCASILIAALMQQPVHSSIGSAPVIEPENFIMSDPSPLNIGADLYAQNGDALIQGMVDLEDHGMICPDRVIVNDEILMRMRTHFGPERRHGEIVRLVVSGQPITDRGAASLRTTHLRSLDISGTHVNGTCFNTFAQFPALEELNI